jgi:hypothetical protein
MSQPWRHLNVEALETVPVSTGVFAVRDAASGIVSIHMAGARSALGLRGELETALRAPDGGSRDFTYVSTNNYFTLYREVTDFPDRFDAARPFVRRNGHTPAQQGPG